MATRPQNPAQSERAPSRFLRRLCFAKQPHWRPNNPGRRLCLQAPILRVLQQSVPRHNQRPEPRHSLAPPLAAAPSPSSLRDPDSLRARLACQGDRLASELVGTSRRCREPPILVSVSKQKLSWLVSRRCEVRHYSLEF